MTTILGRQRSNAKGLKESAFLALAITGIIAGVVQYAPTLISNGIAGNVTLLESTTEDLESGGILRYIKDLYALGLVFCTVLYLPFLSRRSIIANLIVPYLVWAALIVAMGVAPLLFVEAASSILRLVSDGSFGSRLVFASLHGLQGRPSRGPSNRYWRLF